MVELRLSLLTAGNGQRVSTYKTFRVKKIGNFMNAHADGLLIERQCSCIADLMGR